MENLWPIAVGLSILGLIWAVVMTAKFNADREEQRRMNALDAAISTSKESENSQIVRERAVVYQGFLEGKTDAPAQDEPEAQPYQLHAHEAS